MGIIHKKQLTKHLSEQTKFQLDEISKIENYFIEEIKENHAVKN